MTAAASTLAPNVRGAMWMLASAVVFTAMTALIKYLGADYSAAVQSFYRSAAGLVVLLPLILRDPAAAFRTTRPGILLFRAAAGTLAMILGFYSYQTLPLADANALSFTRTLWIVPLAAIVVRETVGPPRIAATLIGFAGVLLMLRPSGDLLFGLPQAAALASALLFALTVTGLKLVTRDNSTFVILCWSATLGMTFSLPPALLSWRTPGLVDLALLSAMGVLGIVTQACYIRGMAIGDAAAMAPIDYSRLVFAVAAGLVLFGEVPTTTTIAGAVIVVAATLFIGWREQHAARRAGAAPTTAPKVDPEV